MTGSASLKPFLIQGKTRSKFCSLNGAFLRDSQPRGQNLPAMLTPPASLEGLTWVSNTCLHDQYELPRCSLWPVPHLVILLDVSWNDLILSSYK